MKINKIDIEKCFKRISDIMNKNKTYLIELDQVNGDGDLGISMSEGFSATYEYIKNTDEKDLGRLFRGASSEFNEAAPSSLGTIISIWLMGIAKATKGSEELDGKDLGNILELGVEAIMKKAGSKVGEKTILDAIVPAINKLKDADDLIPTLKEAAKAAEDGSEATRDMLSVHGRAAYYGEKSLGVIDPGSVAGKLIFEAMADV